MFQLTDQPINPSQLIDTVKAPNAGGLATFEGWVRNHHEGRDVKSLEYEAFPALAEKEGSRIIANICAKHDIIAARCVHRTGHLKIGEIAICIAVSSAHRDAAFDACREIIDSIKSTVPIWKKEHYTDGSSIWVKCHACAEHAHHNEKHHH